MAPLRTSQGHSQMAKEFDFLALELATCLPVNDGDLSWGRGLVASADRSAVPGQLLFSPLAYSLEKRARSISVARCASPVAAVSPVLSSFCGRMGEGTRKAAETAALVSRSLLEASMNQMMSILGAMDEFGAAMRSLLPVPGEQRSEWHTRVNASKSARPMFAAILPGDGVAEVVISQGIFNFLNIYNTVLICRLVLTWFPSAPEALVSPLRTVCDPYLNLFRGLVPPLGGTLDFSPIIAFLVLNAFTNAASALPAELPLGEEAVVAKRHARTLTTKRK